MRPAVVPENRVERYLVGISRVKITDFNTGHRPYIQRVQYLVIEKTVRYPCPVIIFEIVLPEFNIKVGTGTPVAFEYLEIHRGFYFEFAPFVFPKPVPGVDIVIPQDIGLGHRKIVCPLVQQVSRIKAYVQPPVTIIYSYVEI